MYFGLSEDQLMLQDSVGRYLEGASELEEVRKFVDGDGALARLCTRGWMSLACLSCCCPRRKAVWAWADVEAALISETLGRHVSPSAFTAAYGTWRLSACAKQAMKIGCRNCVRQGAYGCRPHRSIGGRDDAGLTVAGDTVSGRASFIMGADGAAHFLLTTGDQLVVVERGAKGVSETELTTIDRTRTVLTLDLDNAAASVVAENNHAEAQRKMIDAGRVLLAADSLGAAAMMLEKAVEYSKDRDQFNRPIASFQAVKHMCAEMAAKLEPCRSNDLVCRLRARPRAGRSIADGVFGQIAYAGSRQICCAHGHRSAWRHGLHRLAGLTLLVQAHRGQSPIARRAGKTARRSGGTARLGGLITQPPLAVSGSGYSDRPSWWRRLSGRVARRSARLWP